MAKRATLQPVASAETLRRVAAEAGHGPPTASVATLRRVAAEAERSLPPAVVEVERKIVGLHFMVGADLAQEIADRARSEGVSQKLIVMQALLHAGFAVDDEDQQDRRPRRGFSTRRQQRRS